MSHANTCLCGRPAAIYGSRDSRLCAGCDADYDTILSLVLGDDFARASAEPAPPLVVPVIDFEFAMVDPAKGDLDGETFTLRDTDPVVASARASERVALLSARLGVRLVKSTTTRFVRAAVGT